ncbi:MAG: hypothetical protein AAGH41_00565 [Pseudomonadota bacterium]
MSDEKNQAFDLYCLYLDLWAQSLKLASTAMRAGLVTHGHRDAFEALAAPVRQHNNAPAGAHLTGNAHGSEGSDFVDARAQRMLAKFVAIHDQSIGAMPGFQDRSEETDRAASAQLPG